MESVCNGLVFLVESRWTFGKFVEILTKAKGTPIWSSHGICSVKKDFQGCSFVENDTLAEVVFCEFFIIFESSFLIEHIWMTASDLGTVCNVSMAKNCYLFLTDVRWLTGT